uniref:FAD/NAD(P)-binding domain-containing protein n=1 Tax=Mycena chlorophos TaxID=658473 RepID=A0ABQ0MDM5_MYCCL|nr:predicted protein [Mycena chlorophos]
MILVYAALLAFVTALVWLQIRCKRPPSWIRGLELLGKRSKQQIPGTAVICGGSVAGILAARVCSDHFEKVLVVDPDMDDPDKQSSRILQWRAMHVYLAIFVQGARRLWPDLEEEVNIARGRSAANDLQLHYSGVVPLVPYDEQAGRLPRTFGMRRATMQKVLHRLLRKTVANARNVTLLAATVRGVGPTEGRGTLETVRARLPDGSQKEISDVALVVDCTGQAQAGFKWLQSAGYLMSSTVRQSYDPNLGYTTWAFQLSAQAIASLPIPEKERDSVISYLYSPHDESTSSLFALLLGDDNVVQLLFGDASDGVAGELPSGTEDILPFLRSYRGMHKPMPEWVLPVVEKILQEDAAPTYNTFHLGPLQNIAYQTLPADTLPSNLIALGDASIYLNPVHGQGFGKAMINAIVLNTLLHSTQAALPADFAHRYFVEAAKCTRGLWDATRLHDYGSLSCKPMDGETKDTGKFVRWIEKKMLSAAVYDAEVGSALWHIRQMLADDTLLLAPSILAKVLWARSLF